jgi:hypothetical protein
VEVVVVVELLLVVVVAVLAVVVVVVVVVLVVVVVVLVVVVGLVIPSEGNKIGMNTKLASHHFVLLATKATIPKVINANRLDVPDGTVIKPPLQNSPTVSFYF